MFIGGRSTSGITTGENQTAGFYNVAIGPSALALSQTGINNTLIGYEAGYRIRNKNSNTFVGYQAGHQTANISSQAGGENNTFVGKSAGATNTQGNNNVGLGANADFVNGTSYLSNAVFIGASTVINGSGTVIIGHSSNGNGDNSIAIGKESSVSANNAIAIGYQASATAANEVVIGNAAHTSIGGPVNWTATSDKRFKSNIKENVVGLDFINQLRPVTYQFKRQVQVADTFKVSDTYTGFIAQEVEQAAENVAFKFSGVDKPTQPTTDFYGLRYAEFVVPLTKAVQELSKENTRLKAKNQQYKSTLATLKKRVEQLEQVNNQLAEQ